MSAQYLVVVHPTFAARRRRRVCSADAPADELSPDLSPNILSHSPQNNQVRSRRWKKINGRKDFRCGLYGGGQGFVLNTNLNTNVIGVMFFVLKLLVRPRGGLFWFIAVSDNFKRRTRRRQRDLRR